jgi:ribosomal protein S26
MKQDPNPGSQREVIASGSSRLSCDECMRWVPAEKAVKAEAQDYLRHFCGLNCYSRWRKRQKLS